MEVVGQTKKKGTAAMLAEFAVEALLEELHLTPKPGLVDCENSGSHHDLNLRLMETSAQTLGETFYDMAIAAEDKEPCQGVREQLAAIGRFGEQKMMQATGNINTHKGAIWSLGLLTAATSILLTRKTSAGFQKHDILKIAGSIAAHQDRYLPGQITNGINVKKQYNVVSAREEAMLGFPTLAFTAIPSWERYRHEPEDVRRLNVLLDLISKVDDTCILHRSNMEVLNLVKESAGLILERGGLGIKRNWTQYYALDRLISKFWVSPGGSADLLASCIFIHKITDYLKIK